MESGFSSEKDMDVSDSEVEGYEEECCTELRTRNHRNRNPEGTFRRLFCAGEKKQDYQFEDLLQNPTGIGTSSSRKGFHTAHHRDFTRFLQHDFAPPLPFPWKISKPQSPPLVLPSPLPPPRLAPTRSLPREDELRLQMNSLCWATEPDSDPTPALPAWHPPPANSGLSASPLIRSTEAVRLPRMTDRKP